MSGDNALGFLDVLYQVFLPGQPILVKTAVDTLSRFPT